MKLRSLILVIALLVPSDGDGRPHHRRRRSWSSTSGIPSANPAVSPLELASFWSGHSWDGWHRGISYLLEEHGVTGLEYLNDGSGNYTSFRFGDDDIFRPDEDWRHHARTNGVLSAGQDGAFTYRRAAPDACRTRGTTPGQFALFRFVIPETTHYFLGVEDMLLSEQLNDHDYNDYVVQVRGRSPFLNRARCCSSARGWPRSPCERSSRRRKARTEAAV